MSALAAAIAALLLVGGIAVAEEGPGAATPNDGPGPAFGTYSWPADGEVIRPFAAPATDYGPGHRGIDIAASPGGAVRAAAEGVVAFAGQVGGDLHISIDHPDGVRTSYAFLDGVSVRRGEAVARGQPIGASGLGHPGIEPPHLHLGARYAGRYIDPLLLLERGSLVGLIRLAPLDEAERPAA